MPPESSPLHRIVDSLRRWQAQRRQGWQLDVVRALQVELNAAVGLAGEAHPALAQALRDFALYVASLVDGEVVKPTAEQRRRLLQLEQEAVTQVRASEPAKRGSADAQVAILADDNDVIARLAEALAGQSLQVRRTQRVAELLPWLGAKGLQAVLVDGEKLLELGMVADRIESRRSKDRLGPTVAFLNRRRLLDERLTALAGGADVCLEGDDGSYLLARVLELVEAQTRQEHLRVLIVEDDRGQAMYCETILRKQGMDVDTVSDSRLALQSLGEFQPDLVLMDLHMPTLDGMQLTALIREDPRWGLLPIVFLTGEQDETRRFDALQIGGDDYLLKPVRPRHLVTSVVTRARRARALRRKFEQLARTAPERHLHAGELVAHLRALAGQAGDYNLLLLGTDDARLGNDELPYSAEREHEAQIGTQLAQTLGTNEALAAWERGSFLVLLGDAPTEQLDQRTESLRQRLQELAVRPASAAIVPFRAGVNDVETTITLASQTLTLARHGGGARVQRALTGLKTELDAAASFALQVALAKAGSKGTVDFEFQPLVPLHGPVRPQFQLHLRLLGEDGRRFTRRQWFDVARQTGALKRLDQALLNHTLDQLKALRERYATLRLIIAVTAESLLDSDFRKTLLGGLAKRQLTEPGLILAVDENDASGAQRKLLQPRLELAAARVALGLARMPVHPRAHELIDLLKPEWVAIDAARALVDPDAKAVISHAHERGAEVVAQGIPDAPAMARLFALGLDYGIGDFIGPPSGDAEFDFGA
ncbi:MAG: response regulator [Xanthomonadales bacterium]|nr:response regulator [Xanthomonadales bacterium]